MVVLAPFELVVFGLFQQLALFRIGFRFFLLANLFERSCAANCRD